MSPSDADQFTDMDDNAIEGAGQPRPCPFCGSGADQLVVERWSAEDDPDKSYHVECLKCGCNGPQADTQVEAAQEWNGRSG
jgi:Lar family restriction alleviation protein